MNISGMLRLEYQALSKITGAYYRASHEKLGHTAAVKPLQSRLDHISILWAARSLRTGDKQIREVFDGEVAPGCTRWHDGMGRKSFKVDGAIPGAFYLTPIAEPQMRSYGKCQDNSLVSSHTHQCLTPEMRGPSIRNYHPSLGCGSPLESGSNGYSAAIDGFAPNIQPNRLKIWDCIVDMW